jgi:hypothetical protein
LFVASKPEFNEISVSIKAPSGAKLRLARDMVRAFKPQERPRAESIVSAPSVEHAEFQPKQPEARRALVSIAETVWVNKPASVCEPAAAARVSTNSDTGITSSVDASVLTTEDTDNKGSLYQWKQDEHTHAQDEAQQFISTIPSTYPRGALHSRIMGLLRNVHVAQELEDIGTFTLARAQELRDYAEHQHQYSNQNGA